jgi:hypothetical protein
VPLPVIVALIVVVSLALLGAAGSLIDASAERHEQAETEHDKV